MKIDIGNKTKNFNERIKNNLKKIKRIYLRLKKILKIN